MSDPLVEVSDLRLAYRLARHGAGSIKEFAIGAVKRRVQFEEHTALDGVTFAVHSAEVLGIVGHNGAGKSTLMKAVARVLPPTAGRVVVRGRVAPMIELGAGFNYELTGAENVVLYGALLGRDPVDMRRRMPHIFEWGDLEEFANVPLRNYSSGMVARLAFAVATDVEPDVLLIDEVLSVGDAGFQIRSKERLRSLIDAGTGAVVVSHDLKALADVATRVMWLERGRVRSLGAAEVVLAQYADAARVS